MGACEGCMKGEGGREGGRDKTEGWEGREEVWAKGEGRERGCEGGTLAGYRYLGVRFEKVWEAGSK